MHEGTEIQIAPQLSKRNSRNFSHLSWGKIGLFCLLWTNCATEKEAVKRVCENTDVCNAFLRVGQITNIQEGPYCNCTDQQQPCSTNWDRSEPRTITWVHHSRGDWEVQYKFCDNLMQLRQCIESEIAAELETPKSSWEPRLRKQYCTCPSVYHLHSWRLIQAGEHNEFWRYYLNCVKRPCRHDEACTRHYVEPGSGKTLGFSFRCICHEGYECPVKKDASKDVDPNRKDEHGVYELDYCTNTRWWEINEFKGS